MHYDEQKQNEIDLKALRYNKETLKNKWHDDEKRYLLKNCKTIAVDKIAEHLNRSVYSVKAMAARIGCGHTIINKE